MTTVCVRPRCGPLGPGSLGLCTVGLILILILILILMLMLMLMLIFISILIT